MKHMATLLFFLLSMAGIAECQQQASFSEIEEMDVADFHKDFAAYCNNDFGQASDLVAVAKSFYGDYRQAIAPLPEGPSLSKNDFAEYQMVSAKDFIVDRAKDYYFLLINEAHHSSQNRAFTRDLLAPLWEEGYRYLALEALTHEDSLIIGAGYPLLNTGYYIKESVFGNMIREALAIGYQLIPYETKIKEDGTFNDGTLRDQDQAHYIYQKTLKKDSGGKVLVHAGYSHISESGGRTYIPMGAQLKELAGQDILTVDQQNMTEKPHGQQVHPLYLGALSNYAIKEAVVFLDGNQRPFVDFINSFGIDIQIYHPATTYMHGRPDWQLTENSQLIALPAEWRKRFEGYLVQAIPEGEEPDAVPVDQFVIDKEKDLILFPGAYAIRLIDRKGTLKGIAALEID